MKEVVTIKEGNMKVSQEFTMARLVQLQSLPLAAKVALARVRILAWFDRYGRDGSYASYSGGKDSTVLLHMIRLLAPDIEAVFCDTGLEYPEIREHVKRTENVTWIRPDMTFKQVIEKYGYPVISKQIAKRVYECVRATTDKRRALLMNHKHPGGISKKWQKLVSAPFKVSDKCCHYMKKKPFMTFERKSGKRPIVGTMASESRMRTQNYLIHGCNSFDNKRPVCAPMSVWNDEDVWEYIKINGLEYASIYDKGLSRTGCMFCAFGAHMEHGVGRFELLKEIHPKIWTYCMDKLGMREVLNYIGVPTGDYKRAKQGKLF